MKLAGKVLAHKSKPWAKGTRSGTIFGVTVRDADSGELCDVESFNVPLPDKYPLDGDFSELVTGIAFRDRVTYKLLSDRG